MGKLKPFLFGTIFGGAIGFVALQYHLVQSEEGFRLVPRSPQPSIGLAYADIRGWGAEDWSDRAALAEAVIADGSTDLITTSVATDVTNSLAPKGSALDKLRGLMNGPGDSSSADSAGFLTIPQNDRTPSESPDLFSIPFPDSARRKPAGGTTAANNSQTQPTNIARRELPSIDETLGTDNSGFAEASNPTRPTSEPLERASSSFDSVRETAAMEELLFGSNEVDDNKLPEPAVSDREASTGLFEEITSQIQERSSQTFGRVESGLMDEARKSLNDAAASAEKAARDQFQAAVPDSVSSMFQEDPLSQVAKKLGTLNQQQQTAPVYEAVENGYDPFIR